jgi:hypothetical protein
MTKKTFCLPTRPYSLVDAVNRAALATGSFRAAVGSASADYNGHQVTFTEPNSFVRYWHCDYFWGERVCLCRGTLAECLAAAQRAYDRGARGASAVVTVETPEDEATVRAAGWLEEDEAKAQEAAWFTPLYKEVGWALRLERQGFPNAVQALLKAKDVAEFRAAALAR